MIEENAAYLMKRFHAHTSQIVRDRLMGEQPAEEVVHEYVAHIRVFHDEPRQSGWAENEVIKNASILQYIPTVEQIMEMTAFM